MEAFSKIKLQLRMELMIDTITNSIMRSNLKILHVLNIIRYYHDTCRMSFTFHLKIYTLTRIPPVLLVLISLSLSKSLSYVSTSSARTAQYLLYSNPT